jgi:hypothetical protein
MEDDSNYQRIIDALNNKASIKQAIYRNTLEVFGLGKKVLSKMASRLHADYGAKDSSVEISYRDAGLFEAELKFSGDMLLLSMHSNIFTFDSGHRLLQSSYVKANPISAYFGVIYIHNFLADSIKYNRLADEGTLVARILVNHEMRFMVEGEGQLGFLYEAFSESPISETALQRILELAMVDCLSNDLMLPPYAAVKDITLQQKQSLTSGSGYPTGKRLGYQIKGELNNN